jgi:adenylosuccinate synthase
MGVTAVIGLQWGDEGKGKVVDVLSRKADVVARCQGGANAGHTMVINGEKHVLHLVPSGILRPATTCVIGNGVVVDLDVLAGEIEDLGNAGMDVSGRLVMSVRAHIVLPLHKKIDLLQEEMRGDSKIGTTKRGIGPCYSDKFSRLGIRVGDILHPDTLKPKLEALHASYAGGRYGGDLPGVEELMDYCIDHEPMVDEFAGDVSALLRRNLSQGKNILLEGSQGFLLDIDHGTYPFVTSSSTGIHGLTGGVGLAPSDVDSIVGVVKSYTTRVGEGILPTMMEEPYQTRVRDRGQEYGATTGRPRRCGWLDLPAIRYSCVTNGVTSIAITKLDTLSGLEGLRVCVAYDRLGACVEILSPDVDFLGECKPCYASCDPWDSLEGIAGADDLPLEAAEYVDRILQAAECPAEMISVGPGREHLIEVRR